MIRKSLKLNQRGYTLVELAIATLILGTLASSVMMARTFMAKQTVATNDQAYASEKAIQMYEELRALVGGNEEGVKILDNYDSGSGYDPILTTDKTVDTGLASANPADPLSGNRQTNGHWRYLRQVTVIPVPNDAYARQVTVRLFKYAGDNSPNVGGTLLAVIGGVLRSISTVTPPSQVMDVYILQVNTVPAWWSDMNTIDQYMASAIADIQNRNPGLIIRPHYITRSAYGRDPFYTPYTNLTNGTDQAASPWVYFYPGMVPQLGGTYGCGCEAIYYNPGSGTYPDKGDPNSLLMSGGFMVDSSGTSIQGPAISQFSTCPAYTVADQYNNAIRYPDEVAIYNQVSYAASLVNNSAANGIGVSIANTAVTEISERMLLEGMNSAPASFQNSMIINLHGELLPLPPMRDYSDAAKDPGGWLTNNYVNSTPATFIPSSALGFNNMAATFVNGTSGLRVTAHPELLYYPGQTSTSTAVTFKLRVYAYYDPATSTPSGDPFVPAISIFFPDAPVTVLSAQYCYGQAAYTYGWDTWNNTAASSSWVSYGSLAADTGTSIIANVLPNGEQTLITLVRTQDHAAPCTITAGTGGGLATTDQLYGTNYIPADVSSTPVPYMGSNSWATVDTFGTDLTSSVNTTKHPKNTARWVLTLASPIHPILSSFPITIVGAGAITTVITSPGVTQTFGGGYTVYPAGTSPPVTLSGMRTIEVRMGYGVTTSSIPGTLVSASTSAAATLYDVPNLERTYVWTGQQAADLPPYTERFQYLGDPRDCPYWDVKNGGVTENSPPVTIGPYAYNWWFKNGSGSGSNPDMGKDGYVGFNQSGNNDSWSGGSNIQDDIPRYYQTIRQGLLSTTSIWATTNGWSFFYYGLGDEVGFDHPPFADGSGSSGVANGGIQIRQAPFLTTTAGENTVQTYDNINNDSASSLAEEWVAADTANSTSTSNWYQRSWLGEIYPDALYTTCWSVYGNLPSEATTFTNALANGKTYFLQAMSKVPNPTTRPSTGGFMGTNIQYNKMAAGNGDTAFFDGLDSGGNNYYTDNASGTNGTALALGVTCYSIFGYPLPNVVGVNREWGISSSSSTAGTSEWSIAPYTTLRTTISIPSVTASSTISRIFYNSDQNSPWNGVGLVQIKKVTSGVTQIGYVLETGTSPSATVGASELAENSLIFSLRSFLDGGVMAVTNAAGHIYQLPLIQAYPQGDNPEYANPSNIPITIASPVTETSGVTIVTPISDIWWRFRGETSTNGNYYTEEYPNYGSPMTATGGYAEGCSIVYNLKYYSDNTVTNSAHNWFFVQDNNNAVTGVYVASEAVTNVQPFVYTWNVSNNAQFPQGGYDFMVEAYRYIGPITAAPTIIPEHYSWHMVHITIDR